MSDEEKQRLIDKVREDTIVECIELVKRGATVGEALLLLRAALAEARS